MEVVKKYSAVEKLSIEILSEFIDKVIVHHREELGGTTTQKIEIFYKMIGNIQTPNSSRKEENQYIKYFGRMNKEKIAVAV